MTQRFIVSFFLLNLFCLMQASQKPENELSGALRRSTTLQGSDKFKRNQAAVTMLTVEQVDQRPGTPYRRIPSEEPRAYEGDLELEQKIKKAAQENSAKREAKRKEKAESTDGQRVDPEQ